MKKAIFLDRDGVLIEETGGYVFQPEKMVFMPGLFGFISTLKSHDFLLIVVTNQAGISRKIYSHQDVNQCHHKLKAYCQGQIDDIYYSPYHPTITKSISRKPETLMLEKAIAKYEIDTSQSWMIGDSDSDMVTGEIMGVQTIQLLNPLKPKSTMTEIHVNTLNEALKFILKESISN